MKTFATLSLFFSAAAAAAQVGAPVTNFYQPDFFGPSYAPGYGYAAFGAPTVAPVVAVNAAPAPISSYYYSSPAAFPYYNNFAYGGFYPYAAPGFAAPFPAATVAPVAAVKAAEGPVAAAAAAEADDVEVVEADSAPLVGSGPVVLRAIFPIFGDGDLRSGSDAEEIIFARPDEVAPVSAVEVGAPGFPGAVEISNPDLATPFATPAGIAQASQPRFFYSANPFAAPFLRA